MVALTPEQAYVKALECYEQGRVRQAEEICRKLLAADPAHCHAAYLLAVIAHRNGNPGDGDAALSQATRQRSNWIRLSYGVPTTARHSETPHGGLDAILAADVEHYVRTLQSFQQYLPALQAIPAEPVAAQEPAWNNIWIPPLDGIALYAFVALQRPRRVIEVGSGHSTKFLRRAIRDQGLGTHLTSIDPAPRAEIDGLCDAIVRMPLENCDLSLFQSLAAGDLLFVDNSHRSFMNSDATVFFTEILPALPAGISVGIHDIFLPYGYPAEWIDRYYSEQYLLACYLLARTALFETVLQMHFLCRQRAGESALAVWRDRLPGVSQPSGTSFWIKTRGPV